MVAIEKSIQILKEKEEMKSFLGGIDYRVARTKEELEAAYSLVYSEYLKRQYSEANEAEMRYSLFNILPSTTTFIAVIDNEIMSTASVILDSPMGLPMDDLYKEELDDLRASRKKICEISMLASDTSLFPSGTSLMLNAKKMFLVYYLFKCVFDYIRQQTDLDYICIAINPKHNLTYESLFFRELGPLKRYDKVNGAPALGKCLNIHDVEADCTTQNRLGIYRLFFQEKTDPEKFKQKYTFTQGDIRYFFMTKLALLQKADDHELDHIRGCYPSIDITHLLPTRKLI